MLPPALIAGATRSSYWYHSAHAALSSSAGATAADSSTSLRLGMHTHRCRGCHLDFSLVGHGDVELVSSDLEPFDLQVTYRSRSDAESATGHVRLQAQVGSENH